MGILIIQILSDHLFTFALFFGMLVMSAIYIEPKTPIILGLIGGCIVLSWVALVWLKALPDGIFTCIINIAIIVGYVLF